MATERLIDNTAGTLPAATFATLLGSTSMRVYNAITERANLDVLFNFFSGNCYLSTMRSTKTGAQNKAAFEADCAAAAGREIIIPSQNFVMDQVVVAGLLVRATAKKGCNFQPSTAAAGAGTYLFRFMSGCDVELKGFASDGQNKPEIFLRSETNNTFKVWDVDCRNYGDSTIAGTLGTCGVSCSTTDHVEIYDYKGQDITAKPNGTYGDQNGKTTHIQIFNCEFYHIDGVKIKGTIGGEDTDHIHIQDLRATTTLRGTLRRVRIDYDHNARRCIKIQGGFNELSEIFVQPGPNFVATAPGAAYSPVTIATQANPVQITAPSHGIANGQFVTFAGMTMVELNGNSYIAANVTTHTLELTATDGLLFTPQSGTGGQLRRHLPLASPGATNAPACVVTVTAHGKTNGQQVEFSGVGGMIELNGNRYFITNVTADTFEIQTLAGVAVNSTAFGIWTSGGEIKMVTDIGVHNVNCIDYAGSLNGYFRMTKSRINAIGYVAGVSHTSGPLGRIEVDLCDVIGSRLRAVRHYPETNTIQDAQTFGFLSNVNAEGSKITNCMFRGWGRTFLPQGFRNIINDNVIDDPADLWIEAGGTATKDLLECCRNEIITRTPGSLSVTRTARFLNYTNMTINDNKLIQRGNTTHAATFISIANASATGSADRNEAPAGTKAVDNIAPGFKVNSVQGRGESALITTTAVGSITTGESSLITHTLPAYTLRGANTGSKTTFILDTVNNANAKELKVFIGASSYMTKALAVSQVGKIEVTVELIGTGASAQTYTITFREYGTASQGDIVFGTLTENSTLGIIIKCTGKGTTTGDIVCRQAVTLSHDGTPLVLS